MSAFKIENEILNGRVEPWMLGTLCAIFLQEFLSFVNVRMSQRNDSIRKFEFLSQMLYSEWIYFEQVSLQSVTAVLPSSIAQNLI